MWDTLWNEGSKELANLPFLMLQQTAVLGILGMILIVFRNRDVGIDRALTLYGVVLGITGYLLTALVADFIKLPAKPYLRSDILFLAGLLGGWRAGSVCFILMLAARLQFGGLAQAPAAALDMATLSAGGVLLHGWIARQNPKLLGLRTLLQVWAARTVFGFLGLLLPKLFNWVPDSVFLSGVARRAFTALPGLFMLAGVLALFRINEQHKQLAQQALDAAKTDAITGLPNRKALQEHLETMLQERVMQPHVLVVIESANYVEMLLAEGHEWSDAMWMHISRLLQEAHVQGLLDAYQPRVFQFSDTSLAMVLHGVSLADIEQTGLAEVLQQTLTLLLRNAVRQAPYPLLSLRVTHYGTERHDSAAKALRDISLRLQNPATGGAAVSYLHQTLAEAAELDASLLTMLMHWIDTKSPPMAYQPKCDLSTGAVTGAEALLRAKSVTDMPVSPVRILAVASRYQLLAAFEWCTIEAVVRDSEKCGDLPSGISLSVNISSASLTTSGFALRLRQLLITSSLPATRLTLELTESTALPDVDAVMENVLLLNEWGIRMSLDDFGSGYSGLTVLARIPFAEVKIDQGMVALINLPRMKSAIQLALESAQRYDAKFVAEGVETQSQSDTLLGMGIGVGQGHLFSLPLVIDDFVHYSKYRHGMTTR